MSQAPDLTIHSLGQIFASSANPFKLTTADRGTKVSTTIDTSAWFFQPSDGSRTDLSHWFFYASASPIQDGALAPGLWPDTIWPLDFIAAELIPVGLSSFPLTVTFGQLPVGTYGLRISLYGFITDTEGSLIAAPGAQGSSVATLKSQVDHVNLWTISDVVEPDPPRITQVERAPRGSGDILSGVGFIPVLPGELVSMVATIADDDGRRDNIVWSANAGVIESQNWDVLTWRAPNVEGTYVISAELDGVLQAGSVVPFQFIPEEPPPGPKCLRVERGPRGSGEILSGEITFVDLEQSVTLVATIENDDGRRNNINWRTDFGEILSQEWDQAVYRAPNAIGIAQVFIEIDGRVDSPCTSGFGVGLELEEPPPFTLDDLLNPEFWEALFSDVAGVVSAVFVQIPSQISALNQAVIDQVQQLKEATGGVAGSTSALVGGLLPPFGLELGANILQGMIPIFGGQFNPIEKAIGELGIPSAEDIWQTFFKQATAPFTGILSAGFTLFFDALEDPLAEIMAPLVDLVLDNPDLPTEAKDLFGGLRQPTQAAQLPLLLMFGAAVIGGVVAGSAHPFVELSRQFANRRFSSTILNPDETIQAFFRGFIPEPEALNLLDSHGYSDENQGHLLELARGILDAGLVNAQVLRWEMGQSAAQAGSEAQALAAEFDQGISPEAGLFALGRLGWEPRGQAQILDQRMILPGVGDLIRYAVREAFTPEIVAKFLLDSDFPEDIIPFTRGQGLPDTFARMEWRAHWELPSIGQAFEMLHRASFTPPFSGADPAGEIDGQTYYTVINEEEVDLLLRTQDVMPFWRERLKQIAFNIVTRVDIRRMYRLGAVTAGDVELTYLSDGYAPGDAAALRLFVEREALNGALGGRESEARAQYRQGLIDEGEFRALIAPVSFLQEVIDETVTTALLDRSGERKIQLLRAWTSAFKDDAITEVKYRLELKGLGVPALEIEHAIEVIDIQRLSPEPSADTAEARAIGSGTSVRRFREGLTDPEEFGNEMGLLGYPPNEIARRLTMANLELDTNLRLDQVNAYRTGLRTDQLTESEFRSLTRSAGLAQAYIDLYVEFDQLRRSVEAPTPQQEQLRALGSGPVLSRFQEGWTTEEEFRDEMQTMGYGSSEIGRYAVLAELRFDLDFKQDSLFVLNDAFNKGIIDAEDYTNRLTTLGMDQGRLQVHLARQIIRLTARDLEVTQEAPPPTLP